ncbi:hypothetical protein [Nonomuraea zeae]|uniref:PE domain-containing protein n=1 Tax=Nonomuraea zeae TaxID=1642303 RepID=A0A5S4GMV7_9ACTN|nr:hypothetical protein [Nonomuraea zeae]TMR34132.1 hypothetical protein ETD85_17655 [Nonomuraea zeae]
MEFDGVVYSRSQLHQLARGAGDMAGRVSGVDVRYETSASAAHAALSDDDYGRAYWQARSQRVEGIGMGLKLLASALGQEETRLQQALKTYRAADDPTSSHS